MFSCTLTKTLSNTTDKVCLFNNISTNTKTVRFEKCKISYSISKDSTWKVYLNPTITSNGTIQTVTNIGIGNTTTNTSNFYKSPTITSNGTLLRTFIITKEADDFYLTIPVLMLEPNNTILIVKDDSDTSETVTIELNWNEHEA